MKKTWLAGPLILLCAGCTLHRPEKIALRVSVPPRPSMSFRADLLPSLQPESANFNCVFVDVLNDSLTQQMTAAAAPCWLPGQLSDPVWRGGISEATVSMDVTPGSNQTVLVLAAGSSGDAPGNCQGPTESLLGQSPIYGYGSATADLYSGATVDISYSATFAAAPLPSCSGALPPSGLSYSQLTATYQVGVAIPADSPTVTGSVTSYSVSPALPAGLTLNGTTGVISGTPTSPSAAASYTVTAANAYGSTTVSLSLAVTSNEKLVFVVEPATTGVVGTALSAQPVVQVQSLSGSLISTATDPVTLSVFTDAACSTAAGSGSLLAQTNPLSANTGNADFSGVGYTQAGVFYLKASAPGINSACSTAITLSPGSPSQLAFGTQPSATGSATAPLSTQPVVLVEDSYGNLVTTATNPVTLAAYSDASCSVTPARGTLSATANPLSAASGQASFAGVGYSQTGTIYLGASASGLTSACSSAIAISPGPAAKLQFAVQPASTGDAVSNLATSPQVEIDDTNGNRVTTASNAITLTAYTDAGCTIGGSGSLNVSSGSVTGGITNIVGVKYSKAETIYLRADATGLTSVCSSAIAIAPGPAAALAFAQVPVSPVFNGSIFSQPPQVEVLDAASNIVISDNSTTVAIAAFSDATCGTAASGSLSGPSSVIVNTGTAYFSGLSYSKAEPIYLGASASGLTSACSTVVQVTGEWTWVGGNSSIGGFGTYGTIGTAAAGNLPGSRSGGTSWMDSSGNLWLFGGTGNAASSSGALNDLWRYNSGLWTWMKGSNAANAPASYGSQGVASGTNVPGARSGAPGVLDINSNLWLLGGLDSSGNSLSDLWQYSTSLGNWTWMRSSSTVNNPGAFGTPGVGSSSNFPSARQLAAAWIDPSGNLWFFGGLGVDGNGVASQLLNDLWKFTPPSTWTWVSGSKGGNSVGSYGTQGVASGSNQPPARSSPAAWFQPNGGAGVLWLFGGRCFASGSPSHFCNDLWKFDPSTSQWTWVGGPNLPDFGGSYGTQGAALAANIPGARQGASAVVDSSGNFWLFGGVGYDATTGLGELNDLWFYSTTSGKWTWAAGSKFFGGSGSFGSPGVGDPANNPPSLVNAAGSIDNSGNIWLFGGNDGANNYNALWKYAP